MGNLLGEKIDSLLERLEANLTSAFALKCTAPSSSACLHCFAQVLQLKWRRASLKAKAILFETSVE